MISYEFITLTHKMIMEQLHTSSIDLYVKHAHLYNFRHKLNSSAYRCRCLCRHSDISTCFVRFRGCRDNKCRLYYTRTCNNIRFIFIVAFHSLTYNMYTI